MNNTNPKPITIAEASTMLRYISAYSREDWLTCGMILKTEFGNDGYSIYDAWSQTADNYDVKAVRAVWKSFKGSGKTIATLIYLAKQNGYREDSNIIPPPIVASKKQPPKESNFDTRIYGVGLFKSANKDDDFVSGHQYAIDSDIYHAAGAGRGVASGCIIGQQADCIIVPCRDIQTDKVIAVQCINVEGKKEIFGDVKCGALILGNSLDLRTPWYVVDGWANAVLMLTNHLKGSAVCIVSFGKALQQDTAELINGRYKPDHVEIHMEADKWPSP
jgi:hypothetical protein